MYNISDLLDLSERKSRHRCPVCDSSDGLSVAPEKGDTGVAHCFACQGSWTGVQMYAALELGTIAEAMQEFGLSDDMSDDLKRSAIRQRQQRRQIAEERRKKAAKEQREYALRQQLRRHMRDRLWGYWSASERHLWQSWWHDTEHDAAKRNGRLDELIRTAHHRARTEEDAVRQLECAL